MSERKEVKITQTGLQPNTQYIARVRTLDKLGNPSGWADAAQFTTPELEGAYTPEHAGPHPVPANFTLEGGYKSFFAQWDDDPAEDMKYGFGKWDVEIEDPVADTVTHHSVTESQFLYSNDDLIPGQLLYVAVRAEDPHGNVSGYTTQLSVATDPTYTTDLLPPQLIPHGQSLQSANWDGTTVEAATDTVGWRLEPVGDAAVNKLRARGVFQVEKLETLPTDPEEASIIIDADEYGFSSMAFVRDPASEAAIDEPTRLENNFDSLYPIGLTTIKTPTYTADPDRVAEVGVRYADNSFAQAYLFAHDDIYIESTDGFVMINAPEVQVAGITVARPPLGIFTGPTQSITSGTETTMIISSAALRNESASGNDYLGFTAGGGAPYVRPLIEGWYRIDATISAQGPADYYAYFGFNIGPLSPVDPGDTEILTGSPNFGGAIGTSANIGGTFYFDGSLDYLRVRGFQASGSSQTVQVRRLEVKFASLP